jgi:hypothetical protein
MPVHIPFIGLSNIKRDEADFIFDELARLHVSHEFGKPYNYDDDDDTAQNSCASLHVKKGSRNFKIWLKWPEDRIVPISPCLWEEPPKEKGVTRSLSPTGVSFPSSPQVGVFLHEVIINDLGKEGIASLAEMIHGLGGIKGFHAGFPQKMAKPGSHVDKVQALLGQEVSDRLINPGSMAAVRGQVNVGRDNQD